MTQKDYNLSVISKGEDIFKDNEEVVKQGMGDEIEQFLMITGMDRILLESLFCRELTKNEALTILLHTEHPETNEELWKDKDFDEQLKIKAMHSHENDVVSYCSIIYLKLINRFYELLDDEETNTEEVINQSWKEIIGE